jgi:hypothetical protein
LRARAEPTLLDASFLGMLLVLPANVRLDWKEIARYKHSSLFGLIMSDEEKSFIKLTPEEKEIVPKSEGRIGHERKKLQSGNRQWSSS